MCRLRRVTLADIPLNVGISDTPRQTIFARTKEGGVYVSKKNPNCFALATAWFGWTTEPPPHPDIVLRQD